MAFAAVRRSRYGFRIIDALNTEWDHLVAADASTVEGWSERRPALAGCANLAEVVHAARADCDGVLAALLTEHAEGCSIAGRTVLQLMLGKAVALALRDLDADVDDYVSAMWCLIRTYPLAERPNRIMANLGLDALKSVKGERQWTRRSVEVATVPCEQVLEDALALTSGHASLNDAVDPELTATGVISAADELGLIDQGTRAVLLSVYSDGLSGRAAAVRHQTTPDMIRYRCSRTLRRLSEHAIQLADAA